MWFAAITSDDVDGDADCEADLPDERAIDSPLWLECELFEFDAPDDDEEDDCDDEDEDGEATVSVLVDP